MPTLTYTRRRFVQLAAAGAGAALLGGCGGSPNRWRFFEEPEGRLVEAIVEQIIPTDEDPGAREAGVANYIDRQLVGYYRRHRDAYRSGLRALQETSRLQHGRAFEELAWDDQTALLRSLEAGEAPDEPWDNQSASSFFRMLRDHSMQGFYGTPRHGGNQDFVSYHMIGLDYPQIIGQNRYRDEGRPPILRIDDGM